MEVTYLAHHGIIGQKWGIRRYQNPDGSLTVAGKNRYVNKLESQTYKSEAIERVKNAGDKRTAIKRLKKEAAADHWSLSTKASKHLLKNYSIQFSTALALAGLSVASGGTAVPALLSYAVQVPFTADVVAELVSAGHASIQQSKFYKEMHKTLKELDEEYKK